MSRVYEFFVATGNQAQLISNECNAWLHEHYTAPGYGKWVTLSVTAFSVLGQV